jgi:hypothetical protein
VLGALGGYNTKQDGNTGAGGGAGAGVKPVFGGSAADYYYGGGGGGNRGYCIAQTFTTVDDVSVPDGSGGGGFLVVIPRTVAGANLVASATSIDMYSFFSTVSAATSSRDTTTTSPVGSNPIKYGNATGEFQSSNYGTAAGNLFGPMTAGDTYMMRVWVRGEQAGQQVRLAFAPSHQTGGYGSAHDQTFYIAAASTWQQISFLCPSITIHLYMRFIFMGCLGAPGKALWFDGLEIIKL